jgi:hypothetical protein
MVVRLIAGIKRAFKEYNARGLEFSADYEK